MAGKSAATPAAWWDVKTRVGKQMHTLIGESFYCTCGFVQSTNLQLSPSKNATTFILLQRQNLSIQ